MWHQVGAQRLTPLAAGITLMLTTSTPAQVLFSFQESDVRVYPGVSLILEARVENLGDDLIFFNSTTVSKIGFWDNIEVDDSLFYGNVPYPLEGGTTWSGAVLQILPGPHIPTGVFEGDFVGLGGFSEIDFDRLFEGHFSLTVLAIPEADMFAACTSVLLVAFAFARVRAREGNSLKH